MLNYLAYLLKSIHLVMLKLLEHILFQSGLQNVYSQRLINIRLPIL